MVIVFIGKNNLWIGGGFSTSYCWYSGQSSKPHVPEFCVKIAQKRASSPPDWLPNEKFIGQVHKVYHIHLNGGKFRQTAKYETGIGLGSVVEPRFVCQARLASNGFRQNDQSENE
jgi:hypothetical protein